MWYWNDHIQLRLNTKTLPLSIPDHCARNPSWFPAQMAGIAERLCAWWCHHKTGIYQRIDLTHCHCIYIEFDFCPYAHFYISKSGGRLNIKMSSYQYRDSWVKDKTVSRTVLSLTWESPYLGKTVFILRRGPDAHVIEFAEWVAAIDKFPFSFVNSEPKITSLWSLIWRWMKTSNGLWDFSGCCLRYRVTDRTDGKSGYSSISWGNEGLPWCWSDKLKPPSPAFTWILPYFLFNTFAVGSCKMINHPIRLGAKLLSKSVITGSLTHIPVTCQNYFEINLTTSLPWTYD